MGNIQFQCPVEFDRNPTSILSCVAKCPAEKGYEIRNVGGNLRCVYKTAPDNYVPLTPVQAIGRPTEPGKAVPPIQSYEALKSTNVNLYNNYSEEFARFQREFAVIDQKVGRDKQIQDAFQALQEAENARDVSPEAYQNARIRYYTLTKGDGWIDEERERTAKVEVTPVIKQYANQYADMKHRNEQQQRTIDVVNGVKDKLLSVQDELETSVNAFSRQINGLKNMINMEREKRVEEKVNTYSWIGIFLNILLVVAIVFAIISIVRSIMSRKSAAAQPLVT
jgi:hypothetical protein